MADRYFRLRNTKIPPHRRRGGLKFASDQPTKIPPRIKPEDLRAIEEDPYLVEVVDTAAKGEKPRWKLKAATTAASAKSGKKD